MKFFLTKNRELEQLKHEYNILLGQTRVASEFIKEIEKRNFQINIPDSILGTELGGSLLSMKNHLSKIEEEEQERTWVNTGLAMFSDILRNKDSLTVDLLGDSILSNIVKYVNANQGVIFVIEGNQNEKYLNILSCYAYDRKKYLNKQIEIGEGLAGQCVLEKEMIYMSEIPSNYVSITSGLGESTPKYILLSPLKVNEEVYGVLELASFESFSSSKIEFIKMLSENIAASIKNVKGNEKTLDLLKVSQLQTEELRSAEEEMRQNMEELHATQEQMERKSMDLDTSLAEMNGVLKGINATMATIEFNPEGIINTANNNFLNTMKYSLEQIKGKHHSMFVPKEILDSDDYQTFWKRLANGEPSDGVFKRVSSTGESIWMRAIYNPLFDSNGKVVKVVKFAIDISAEQEMIAENNGILNGINATMATIEFKPDGSIITANDNFLKWMNYSIDQIKGKHHRIFVPEEILMSEEYKNFWETLSSGKPFIGTFKRINSKGEAVLLNAIYNPISNSNGKVFKVIKFASVVS